MTGSRTATPAATHEDARPLRIVGIMRTGLPFFGIAAPALYVMVTRAAGVLPRPVPRGVLADAARIEVSPERYLAAARGITRRAGAPGSGEETAAEEIVGELRRAPWLKDFFRGRGTARPARKAPDA